MRGLTCILQGKHVDGNQEGGVDIKKMRTWRQYMNRCAMLRFEFDNDLTNVCFQAWRFQPVRHLSIAPWAVWLMHTSRPLDKIK